MRVLFYIYEFYVAAAAAHARSAICVIYKQPLNVYYLNICIVIESTVFFFWCAPACDINLRFEFKLYEIFR